MGREGIYVGSDAEKVIPFKLLKGDGYVYELPDGTIAKLTFTPQRVTRTPTGSYKAYGTSDLKVVSAGPTLTVFQPATFIFPEKRIKDGCYSFEVADQKQSVTFRPSLKQVERVVGPNGSPRYLPTVVWVSNLDQSDFLRANTWSSTFARMGGSREDITTAAVRQRELLEWLFQDRTWFQDGKNRGHPAYIDWHHADDLAKWLGRKPDSLKPEELHFMGRIALNTALLVGMSGGDLTALTPGTFEAFGDLNVQKKIRSRVTNPSSYEDLLVELYTASWHRTKGREVELLETTGYPDVRVGLKELEYPVYIECKRLTVSSVNQIQTDVKDASNKIKRAMQGQDSNAYGAVLLDFSTVTGLHRQENQSIPPQIEDVKAKVRQAMRGAKNTHVESAVVAWDDYGVVGEEPEQWLIFRRRAELIRHELARRNLKLEILFNGYGVRIPFRNIPDEML